MKLLGKKKTTKTKRQPDSLDKLAARGITPRRIMGALMLVIVISLGSMKMALVATGFAVIGAFAVYDSKRRQEWESLSHEKISQFSESHNQLLQEVIQHRNDIAALKNTPAGLAASIQSATPKPQQTQPPSSKKDAYAEKLRAIARRSRETKENSNILNLDVMPGFLRKPTITPETTPEVEIHKSSYGTFREPPPTAANDRYGEETPVFSDSVVAELVEKAIQQKRPEIFLQPVMHMPQRRPLGYEIFTRIRARPGLYLTATRYKKLTDKNAMSGSLDVMALMSCLKVMERQKSERADIPLYFINATEKTLINPLFMKELVSFLAQNKKLASHIVFEFSQETFTTLGEKARKVFDTLKAVGCRFSLDHVYDSNLKPENLAKDGFSYIKLDAGWLRGKADEAENLKDILSLKKLCEKNNIAVIAEKIESEDDIRALMDMDLHYAQGFLLGKPDMQGVYTPEILRKKTST